MAIIYAATQKQPVRIPINDEITPTSNEDVLKTNDENNLTVPLLTKEVKLEENKEQLNDIKDIDENRYTLNDDELTLPDGASIESNANLIEEQVIAPDAPKGIEAPETQVNTPLPVESPQTVTDIILLNSSEETVQTIVKNLGILQNHFKKRSMIKNLLKNELEGYKLEDNLNMISLHKYPYLTTYLPNNKEQKNFLIYILNSVETKILKDICSKISKYVDIIKLNENTDEDVEEDTYNNNVEVSITVNPKLLDAIRDKKHEEVLLLTYEESASFDQNSGNMSYDELLSFPFIAEAASKNLQKLEIVTNNILNQEQYKNLCKAGVVNSSSKNIYFHECHPDKNNSECEPSMEYINAAFTKLNPDKKPEIDEQIFMNLKKICPKQPPRQRRNRVQLHTDAEQSVSDNSTDTVVSSTQSSSDDMMKELMINAVTLYALQAFYNKLNKDDELKKQNENLKNMLDETESKQTKLVEHLENMNDAIKQKEEMNTRLITELSHKQKEVMDLNESNKTNQNEVNILNEEMNIQQKEYEQMKEQYDRDVKALQEQININETINKELTTLLDKNKQDYQQIQEQHDRKIQELQKQIGTNETNNQELTTLLDKNKQEYEQIKAKHDSDVQELQEQLNASRNIIEDKQNELLKTQKEYEQMKEKHIETITRLTETHDKESKQIVEQKSSDIVVMQNKLNDATNYINELEKIIFNLKDEISNSAIIQQEVNKPDYSQIISLFSDIVQTIQSKDEAWFNTTKEQMKVSINDNDTDYLNVMKETSLNGEITFETIQTVIKIPDIEELERVLKIIHFYVMNPFMRVISIFEEDDNDDSKYFNITNKQIITGGQVEYSFDEVFTTSKIKTYTIADTKNVDSLLQMFNDNTTGSEKNYIIFQYGLSGSGKTFGAKKIIDEIKNNHVSDTLIYGKRGNLTNTVTNTDVPQLKFTNNTFTYTEEFVDKKSTTDKLVTIYGTNIDNTKTGQKKYLTKSAFIKSTDFNKDSSRGHRIHHYKSGNNNLYLCDLAGIESVSEIIYREMKKNKHNIKISELQTELNNSEKDGEDVYKFLEFIGRILYQPFKAESLNWTSQQIGIYQNLILFKYIFSNWTYEQIKNIRQNENKKQILQEWRHKFDIIAESYFICHTLNNLENSLTTFNNQKTSKNFAWNFYSPFKNIKIEKILFNGFVKNSVDDADNHKQTLKFVSNLGQPPLDLRQPPLVGGRQFGPNSQLPTNATDVSMLDTNTKQVGQPVNTFAVTEQSSVDVPTSFDTKQPTDTSSLEQPTNPTDTMTNLNATLPLEKPIEQQSLVSTNTSPNNDTVSPIDTPSPEQPVVNEDKSLTLQPLDTTTTGYNDNVATTDKVDKNEVIENMVIDSANKATEESGNFINKIMNMDENNMFNLYLMSFIGINFAATQFALYIKNKLMEKDVIKSQYKKQIVSFISLLISVTVAVMTGAIFFGINNALVYIGSYTLISSLDFFNVEEKYLDEDTDIEIYAWIIASIIFTFYHE
jgi:hypothetical protein